MVIVVVSMGLASRRWRQLTEDAALWHTLHEQLFGGPPVSAVSLKLVRNIDPLLIPIISINI
jgi:hypothetical protein